MIKNRCSPVSLVLFIAVCAFLICTVNAQAGASAAGAAGSNAVTASVRSVQPAVSGLFQVHAPRVWADEVGGSGELGANGVPDFLDSWQAFHASQASTVLKNAYAFRTRDGQGDEILYAGVLRASSGGPGKVVFEFNLNPGERLPGDLRIEAEIDAAGNVGTARFESFSGESAKGSGKFLTLALLSGEGCNDSGAACIVANGALLEVGFNLSRLLNGSGGFKTVKITTPEDSVVGTFSTGVPDGCLAEVFGKKVNCTANDVRLTAIVGNPTITKACGPQFCTNDATKPCARNADCPGSTCNFDTMTFSAVGQFTSGPARYDVGIYIATDDDANGDLAQSGLCTRFSFEANSVNHDGDACGDTDAFTTQDVAFGPVTIKCNDADNDGRIDIKSCETWGNAIDEIPNGKTPCTGPNDVRVGTPSKCFCSQLPICVAVADANVCDTEVCRFTCSATSTVQCDPTSASACNNVPANCQERVVHVPVADGAVCGPDPDPANPCDINKTCVAGACTGTGFAGSSVKCRDSACDTTTKLCCDVPEFCTGTSSVCPDNGFKASTVECRASACDTTLTSCCDVPENCTGSSAACPADGFATDAHECRAKTGICDVAEHCDGTKADCPTDLVVTLASNTECRQAFNECDAHEVCDGINKTCPTDYCAANTPLRVNPFTCTPPAP